MLEHSATFLDWFPQTKYHFPVLDPETVIRPRLLTGLRQAVKNHRITLISAPAGSGKTTLLASLPTALPGFPMAWFSLGEEDNDPAYFLPGLAAALRQLNHLTSPFPTLLGGLDDAETEGRRYVGGLINEIIQTMTQPFALVLDDLHMITNPTLYTLLDYFIERLPTHAHLIIGTRYDPPLSLPRFRARGQLAEIRLPQLRFNSEELTSFFDQRLDLKLTETDIEILLRQTNGWAAGLRLLANSLNISEYSNEQNRLNFLATFAQTEQHIFEYLADEVFSRLDLVEQTFLLETSILSELNPELCEAVSGRADSGELLEKLYRKNLFLLAIDQKKQTYRYHDLFSAFLQNKLTQEMPEAVSTLHKCAAHAYNELFPSKVMSVRHLLTGQYWEEAADLIEEIGDVLLKQGMQITLNSWIQLLPEAIIRQHPRLNYYLGFFNVHQFAVDVAYTHLQTALAGFKAQGKSREMGLVLVQLVLYGIARSDFELVSRYYNEALDTDLSPKSRVQLLMSRGYQVGLKTDWQEFGESVKQSFDLALEANEPEIFYEVAFLVHTLNAHVPGLLAPFEKFHQEMFARFKGKDIYLETSALFQLSYTSLLRGNLERSLELLQQAKIASRNVELSPLQLLDLSMIEVNQMRWQGAYPELEKYYQGFIGAIEPMELSRPWLGGFLGLCAINSYQLGKHEDVKRFYNRMEQLANNQERPENRVIRLNIQALIELHTKQYLQAEQHLQEAVALQKQLPFSFIYTNAKIWLAHLYLNWERPRQALAEVEGLLTECEQEGIPGLILRQGAQIALPLLKLALEQGRNTRYARELLRLIGFEQAEKILSFKLPDSEDALSLREIEVLRLLVVRATNREIADQLVISPETVKTHVRNIMQKLGINSRKDVAARASELGLL